VDPGGKRSYVLGRPAFVSLVAALAVFAAAAVGCGETVIDDVKTEAVIKDNVESKLGLKVSSVDCPSDVEVEAGAVFECTVAMGDGKERTAKLKILNEDADVEFLEFGQLVDGAPNDG
jgi:hypothetical protein